MSAQDNFLHTTHRTITWFKKAFLSDDLVLAAPFQRNAVWTNRQKSYLIDTVLNALPIPELYMQDVGNESGEEKHIVVDGQQRIRAVLEYVNGEYSLDGDDVRKAWRGLSFEDLSVDEKKLVYNYKFVVRILPPGLKDEDIRGIFSRLNKNVVVLTDQELRNATYWGHFISAIHHIADEDPFWADCGIFSANDHRRMIDHEFISELAVAYLHGSQNKKDRLNQYYQMYEESFENKSDLIETFRKVTAEIARVIPRLAGSRWKKKSDFYTLFLEFSRRKDQIPFDEVKILNLSERLVDFGSRVDGVLRLEEEEWGKYDANVVSYAKNVSRAASDRGNRVARSRAFSAFVFNEILPLERPPVPDVTAAAAPAEADGT